MKIHSKVHDGLISPEAYSKLRDGLTQHEQSMITITVAKQVKRRSGNQNAFYYGVVLPLITALFREYGDNICPEEVHRYLKGTIGGYKKPITTPDGEVIWHVDTSTKLTTAEWEVWMDLIRAWAAARGVQVPYPNELTIEEYNQ